jgi:hypothetical protein
MREEKLDVEDIYYYFRKAQANSNNRGFRMPKDFDKHFNTKMSEKNREALTLAVKYFNTKWSRIDPFRFMKCGFELFKSFSYTKFFDRRVLNLYIQKDKHIKRDAELCKGKMTDSALFVLKYMKENKISSLSRYCMMKTGAISYPVKHYIDNSIDKFFVVWLVTLGLLDIDDDNRALVPYIVEQYRDILSDLDNISGYLSKLKKLIGG